MWPRKLINQRKEAPLRAEPEAPENNGQRSSFQRTEPGLVGGFLLPQGLGVLQSICSVDSRILSVTNMGLPFFLFQMGELIKAILDVFCHSWDVYGGGGGGQAAFLFSS